MRIVRNMRVGMRSLREQFSQGATALLAGLGIGLLVNQLASSSVSIDTDNKTATVYVPVFIDGKGTVLNVYEDTAIFGNATYEIVDTEYGKAMKVTATGNVLIFTKHPDGAKRSNSAVNRYLKDFGLSMSDFKPFEGDVTDIPPVKIMPNTAAWMYSDSELKFLGFNLDRDSGVGITYIMGYSYNGRSENMTVPANLKRGWQRIELETSIRRYRNFL